MSESYKNWNKKASKAKIREYSFDTVSGVENDILYSPLDENDNFLRN